MHNMHHLVFNKDDTAQTACGQRLDLIIPGDQKAMTFRPGVMPPLSHSVTIDGARATCLQCHKAAMKPTEARCRGHHFMLDGPLHIADYETIKMAFMPTADGEGRLASVQIVALDGSTKRDASGRVLDGPPLDPRCRLPITIDGVNFYRGA